MNTYRTLYVFLLFPLIISFSVCKSIDKTEKTLNQKEIILERDLIVSNECQNYTPEKTIEERFFGGVSPTLFAILNQDTLKLDEYKLLNTEFSKVDNVSFYAHYNSDGQIHKVETSGEYQSIDKAALKEIAKSFVIRFPDKNNCFGDGMISGIF